MARTPADIVNGLMDWAEKELDTPYVFVSHVEGCDSRLDLIEQIKSIETSSDILTAMRVSQEMTFRSSLYVREVLDAVADARWHDAETLVRAQRWPSINVTTERRDTEMVLRRTMGLGVIELDACVFRQRLDTGVYRQRSPVAEVRLIAQGWTSSNVAIAYGRMDKSPTFNIP